MNRLLVRLPLIIMMLVIPVIANAAPVKRSAKPRVRTTPDVIARTRWIDDGVGERHVYDLTRARFGDKVIIDGLHFAGEFSDGGSFDLSADEVTALRQWRSSFPDGTRFYVIPTTNPLWYDKKYGGHQPKIDAKNNASLRVDRGAWINDVLGYEADVYAAGMIYNQKGAFVVAFRDPPAPPAYVPPPTTTTSIPIPGYGFERKPRVEFRPTLGYSYTHIDDVDYATPTAGMQLLIRAHQDTWIGAYYVDGYTFAGGYGDRRRMAGVIIRDGDRGFVGKIGGTGAWTINGSSGLAKSRALGMDVGLGYDFGPVIASLSAGVYQSSKVTDRDPETAGTIGLLLDVAPRVRL